LRDTWLYVRSLLTFRENPFFLRAVRRELRNKKLVRNQTIALVCLMLLCVTALMLGSLFGPTLARVGLPQGTLLAIILTGAHVWFIIIAVSFRSRDSIDLESRMETLDLLRATPLTRIQIMGMKGTYPLVFGVVMALLLLPLYGLTVAMGGLRAAEVCVVFLVLALTCVRPSGSSGAWYTAKLQPTDERKKRARQKSATIVIWIQVFCQGWARLAPKGYLGSPLTATLMPVAWVAWVSRAGLVDRPFYGIHLPFIIVLPIALAFGWTSLAVSSYRRVVSDGYRLSIRHNPAWHLWAAVVSIAVVGYLWGFITGPHGLAVLAGGSPGNADASIAAVFIVLAAVWAVPVGLSLLFTGGTEAGLLPCGKPLAESRDEALRDELVGVTGTLSVLVLPSLAMTAICLLGWHFPAAPWCGVLVDTLVTGAAFLLYCFGIGRTLAMFAVRNEKRKFLIGSSALLLLIGSAAALFPLTRVPLWVFALNPFSGFVTLSPQVSEWITSGPAVTPVLPLWAACVVPQALLGVVMAGIALRIALAKARPREVARPDEAGPTRPTQELFKLGYRPYPYIANPVALRYLRSKYTQSAMQAAITVPSVLVLSAVLVVVLAPDALAAPLMRGGLIVWASPAAAGAGIASYVVGMLILWVWSCIAGFATAARMFPFERDRGTVAQLFLTPLSNRTIALGFQVPGRYATAVAMLIMAPLGIFGVIWSGDLANVAVILCLLLFVAADVAFSVSCGALIGVCVKHRPVFAPVVGILWGAERIALLIGVVAALVVSSRIGGGQLIYSRPMFWIVLLAEAALAPVLVYLTMRSLHEIRSGDIPFMPGEEPKKRSAG